MNMMDKFVTHGVYVMAKYDTATCKNIHVWAKDHKIPAPLEESKLHSTIIESRNSHIHDYHSLNREVDGISFTALSFTLGKTRFKSLSGKPESALIVLLNAPELVEMHKEMIDRGGRHNRDSYEPHVAISYFVPNDFSLSTLPLPTFKFTVQSIVAEPTDIDWLNH